MIQILQEPAVQKGGGGHRQLVDSEIGEGTAFRVGEVTEDFARKDRREFLAAMLKEAARDPPVRLCPDRAGPKDETDDGRRHLRPRIKRARPDTIRSATSSWRQRIASEKQETCWKIFSMRAAEIE